MDTCSFTLQPLVRARGGKSEPVPGPRGDQSGPQCALSPVRQAHLAAAPCPQDADPVEGAAGGVEARAAGLGLSCSVEPPAFGWAVGDHAQLSPSLIWVCPKGAQGDEPPSPPSKSVAPAQREGCSQTCLRLLRGCHCWWGKIRLVTRIPQVDSCPPALSAPARKFPGQEPCIADVSPFASKQLYINSQTAE